MPSQDSPNTLYRVVAMTTLLLAACQPSVPIELQQIVNDVRTELAPDSRVAIFDVTLAMEGGRLTLQGEVDNGGFRDSVISRLAGGGAVAIDKILVLPEQLPDSTRYGIVRISVAHMRSRPSIMADLLNQPVLGDVVRLLKFDDGYYLVQNWDGYIGWIRGGSLAVVDSVGAARWRSGRQVVHRANYGVVREEPDMSATILVDLVAGAHFKLVARNDAWSQVELPTGQLGYLAGDNIVELGKVGPSDASTIMATAQKFRGIPYLWGGTSTKAFDCSGFTQTVFRLNGIELPRDASQQALVGQPVPLDDNFAQLIPGDLLFFGPNEKRITHVAIYRGRLHFIHAGGANGQVAINSLDPESDLFSRYRLETLRYASRMTGEL